MDSLLTTVPFLPHCALAAFAASIAAHYYFAPSRHRLPPGPRPLPFIGNALQISKAHPEECFTEWGVEFGDILCLKTFGQKMIILNSLEAARDLLDKRGSIYSDRPRFVLFSELMGWKHATTHVRYGQGFRRQRRWINQIFNARNALQLRPLQTKETLVLLDGMIREPESFVKYFKRFAAATILKITYGRNVESEDDFLVKLAVKAATLTIESGTPAASLVDFFPVMRYMPTWFPFASFKRNALKTREAVDALFQIPYDLVRKDMKAGMAGPSYVSVLVEKLSAPDGILSPEVEDDIQGSAATLYAAAEDTTVSRMHTFILAMVLYPDVYKKLQAEIDSVLGNKRLPTFDDKPLLPYLECVLKEILRWHVPVPLGIPHRLMEDDVYRDFFLPEGATVMANIHAIMQDCHRPDEFIPERYLEDPELPDPRTVVFGFGRRICPGRHFGEDTLWSVIANLAATMDISKALDENGAPITPPVEFTSGFISHPKPFKCQIKPRSDRVQALIQQTDAGDYVFPSDTGNRFKH